MTLQLNWPPEAIEQVKEEARKRGLTVDAYVLQAALPHREESTYEELSKQKRQQAAAEIRELRKGNTLGPDLTIRDLIEEGRRF